MRHCHGDECNSVSTGFFASLIQRQNGLSKLPPITKAKKISTAAKSSPEIVFLLMAPHRAVGLRG
jgi:hypothetical protein